MNEKKELWLQGCLLAAVYLVVSIRLTLITPENVHTSWKRTYFLKTYLLLDRVVKTCVQKPKTCTQWKTYLLLRSGRKNVPTLKSEYVCTFSMVIRLWYFENVPRTHPKAYLLISTPKKNYHRSGVATAHFNRSAICAVLWRYEG